MDFETAIGRAYSSKLRVERRGDQAVILKSVGAGERKNEIAFHELLCELQLPSMEVLEEGEDLSIGFIEGADTLADEETPERYEQLGASLQRLHSRVIAFPFWVDEQGVKRDVSWRSFLDQQIKQGVARQAARDGLRKEVVDRMVPALSAIADPVRVVPIHGDIHANNVLLKGEDLYLFDKADHIFAGDALYDMSLFGITLPGVYGVGSNVKRDQNLMQALIQGYGVDILSDRSTFDHYVLLRSLERCPNPFESEIPEVVEAILQEV